MARQLTDIKARDGGDITMSGSPTTVRWLLREGLRHYIPTWPTLGSTEPSRPGSRCLRKAAGGSSGETRETR